MAKKKKVSLVVSEKRRRLVLKYLRQTGKVNESCQRAGYADATYIQRLRNTDPEFSKAFDEAREVALSRFEDELVRRGVDGVEREIFFKGEVCGREMQYSDQLLMFLLKANDPAKYRDRAAAGDVNVNIGVALLPQTAPDPVAWEQNAQVMHANQPVLDVDFEDVTPEPAALQSTALTVT